MVDSGSTYRVEHLGFVVTLVAGLRESEESRITFSLGA